jgi:hypothetical protein
MRYLQVKDWRRFQHYAKRNPPWIKLHNSLLENPEFASLPDAAKAHLIGIWLLASRTENRIPEDAEFVGNRINAQSKVDLKKLISCGFLEVQPASSVLANCEHIAIPETETETETEQNAPNESQEPGEEMPLIKNLAFEGQVLEITEREDDALGLAYPHIDRVASYRQMDAWLVANPERRKKKFAAFARNWMSREPKPSEPVGSQRVVEFGVKQPSEESKKLLEKLGV